MTRSGTHSTVGAIYILAAVISWGVYFPFAKLILEKLSPVVFLTFRLGIGTLILLALCMRHGRSLKVARRDIVTVITAGVIGIIIHQLIQLAGLKLTTRRILAGYSHWSHPSRVFSRFFS